MLVPVISVHVHVQVKYISLSYVHVWVKLVKPTLSRFMYMYM